MSFSYDPTQLDVNEVYQIRATLGISNEDNPVQIDDELIQFNLNSKSSFDDALRATLENCIAYAANLSDNTTGTYEEDYSGVLDNFLKMRDQLGLRVVPVNMVATGLMATDYYDGQHDASVYQTRARCKDEGPLSSTSQVYP